MERVLSEKNGIQIVRTEDAYEVRDCGCCTYRVPDGDSKEFACLKALSEYLKATGKIARSYDDANGIVIPYDRLIDIATRAIKKMDEREEFIDVYLSGNEAKFLDVIERPYEIRTYCVQKTIATEVTVAVHKDCEDQIESELSDYCDNIDAYKWDFVDYDTYYYDTEMSELTEEEMESEDVDLVIH